VGVGFLLQLLGIEMLMVIMTKTAKIKNVTKM
jgi:hypothetical protein